MTGQNLALKRENESLHSRARRSRYMFTQTHTIVSTWCALCLWSHSLSIFCPPFPFWSSLNSPKSELDRQDTVRLRHQRSSSFSNQPPIPTDTSALARKRYSLNRSSPEVDSAGNKQEVIQYTLHPIFIHTSISKCIRIHM